MFSPTPPPTVAPRRRTSRVTLKDCEAALTDARSGVTSSLVEIVDRERHRHSRCVLLGVSPDTSVSRWLLRKFIIASHDRNSADFRLLVDVGAHEASRRRGNLPLHVAAHFGFAEGVELLLANGAEVMAETAMKSTPLHMASRQAQTTVIGILVEKGAAINPLDAGKMTPLQRLLDGTAPSSARPNVPLALQLLLQAGAHTNAAPSS